MSLETLNALAHDLAGREYDPHGPTFQKAIADAFVDTSRSGRPIAFGWQINDDGYKALGHCPADIIGTDLQAAFIVDVIATLVPRLSKEPKLLVSLAGDGCPTIWIPVATLLDASQLCRVCIQFHDMGASHWAGGMVTDARGKYVARISYNGRAWKPGPDGAEIQMDGAKGTAA